jgi:dynein assembly factor 1
LTLSKIYLNTEKERHRLAAVARDNNAGLPDMSAAEIRLSCLENDGYETPELNDKLYLHFRGFKRIQNLEPYTGCTAIWLDSNGFERIEGLDTLVNLRCLYLSKNLISKIEGLSHLCNLTTLDLSNNRITYVENLSDCPNLQSVNLSKNGLATAESIAHFSECMALHTLDLSDNLLDGDVIPTLAKVPALVSLAINGNPTVRSQGFRKRAIVELPKLCYLDRPVEEQERIGAIAFASGGVEAERAAKEKYREDQRMKRSNEMETFRQWQRDQRLQRQEAISQGRFVGVREFTAEDLERRRVEAEDAANAERDLIAAGLPKVAAKYWQMESSSSSSPTKRDKDGYNFDALDAAVREIKAEEERRRRSEQQPRLEDSDMGVESRPPSDADAHADNKTTTATAADAPSIPTAVGMASEANAASTLVSNSTASSSVDIPPPPPTIASVASNSIKDTSFSDVSALDVTAQNISPAPDSEQEDELRLKRELEARVMESLEIYKRQRDAAKANTGNAASDGYVSNTWSSHVGMPSSVPKEERPLYWTETMDFALAKLVREHNFDFYIVAATLRDAMGKGDFGPELVDQQQRMTYDTCRIRWSQLDARHWSVLDDSQKK